MQVSAALSAGTASLSESTADVILWITVRNPFPYPVVLGTPADYPWWSVTIEPVGSDYSGVWILRNPRQPLALAAGADTVYAFALHIHDSANQLEAGDYNIRGGLDYTMSGPQRLRIED